VLAPQDDGGDLACHLRTSFCPVDEGTRTTYKLTKTVPVILRCERLRASKDGSMGIYVYMLRCADNSFYVGSATGDDVSPRVDQRKR